MFEIKPKIVQKEIIDSLQFPNSPLEHTQEKENYLTVALQKAMELGNENHTKFKIVFFDSSNILEVETTVWESNDDEIVLKNGIKIPRHRVLDVKLR